MHTHFQVHRLLPGFKFFLSNTHFQYLSNFHYIKVLDLLRCFLYLYMSNTYQRLGTFQSSLASCSFSMSLAFKMKGVCWACTDHQGRQWQRDLSFKLELGGASIKHWCQFFSLSLHRKLEAALISERWWGNMYYLVTWFCVAKNQPEILYLLLE